MADLDERIRETYAVAMKASHSGSRVEIHLGKDIVKALREGLPDSITVPPHTFWGFPFVEEQYGSPDHISVHTIQVIL